MRTIMNTRAMIGLALVGAAWDAQAQRPARSAASDRVRTMIERAVPTWSDSVLQIPDREDWSKGIGFAAVLSAMQDQRALPADMPPGLQQLRLGETSLRLKPRIGRIRYISGDRQWHPDSTGAPAGALVDSARATALVLAAVQQLRVPRDEIGVPRTNTQMAAIGATGAQRPDRTYEMYRVVSLPRLVHGIIVDDSRVIASVNRDGAIQRLLIAWPPFRLERDLVLRARAAVIDEALSQIMQQSPSGQVEVRARLVYAARGRDEGDVSYTPAVAVSVVAPPTPYVITVPVAQ